MPQRRRVSLCWWLVWSIAACDDTRQSRDAGPESDADVELDASPEEDAEADADSMEGDAEGSDPDGGADSDSATVPDGGEAWLPSEAEELAYHCGTSPEDGMALDTGTPGNPSGLFGTTLVTSGTRVLVTGQGSWSLWDRGTRVRVAFADESLLGADARHFVVARGRDLVVRATQDGTEELVILNEGQRSGLAAAGVASDGSYVWAATVNLMRAWTFDKQQWLETLNPNGISNTQGDFAALPDGFYQIETDDALTRYARAGGSAQLAELATAFFEDRSHYIAVVGNAVNVHAMDGTSAGVYEAPTKVYEVGGDGQYVWAVAFAPSVPPSVSTLNVWRLGSQTPVLALTYDGSAWVHLRGNHLAMIDRETLRVASYVLSGASAALRTYETPIPKTERAHARIQGIRAESDGWFLPTAWGLFASDPIHGVVRFGCGALEEIVVAPDGKVALLTGVGVFAWDRPTRALLSLVPAPPGSEVEVADDARSAGVLWNGTYEVWKLGVPSTKVLSRELSGTPRLASDGSALFDGSTQLLRVADGEKLYDLPQGTGEVLPGPMGAAALRIGASQAVYAYDSGSLSAALTGTTAAWLSPATFVAGKDNLRTYTLVGAAQGAACPLTTTVDEYASPLRRRFQVVSASSVYTASSAGSVLCDLQSGTTTPVPAYVTARALTIRAAAVREDEAFYNYEGRAIYLPR